VLRRVSRNRLGLRGMGRGFSKGKEEDRRAVREAVLVRGVQVCSRD